MANRHPERGARPRRATRRLGPLLPTAALLACLLGAGCAAPRQIGDGLALEELPAPRGTLLGGEELAQMKQRMRRAQRDMAHFHAGVELMQLRSEPEGYDLLVAFLDGYLTGHLDPMLRSEWQSRHPELMGIDANLRLLEAQLLIQIGDRSRVKRVLEEIGRRYQGRNDMMVEYPIGSQSTLGEALHVLESWSWRG